MSCFSLDELSVIVHYEQYIGASCIVVISLADFDWF